MLFNLIILFECQLNQVPSKE